MQLIVIPCFLAPKDSLQLQSATCGTVSVKIQSPENRTEVLVDPGNAIVGFLTLIPDAERAVVLERITCLLGGAPTHKSGNPKS